MSSLPEAVNELVAFLHARLDEDELMARAATPKVADPRMEPGVWEHVGETRIEGYLLTIFPGGGHDEADAEHIARHDPARVLAEVEAKRRIVELHGRAVLRAGGGAQYFATQTVCRSCEPPQQLLGAAWPCETLRLLALPYASHPAFKEEWRHA